MDDLRVRWLRWTDFVAVVADEPPLGDGPTLQGWYFAGEGRVPAGVEIRAGVSLGMTWADASSRGAEWVASLWEHDGLHGTLDNDLVADVPPGDSRISAIGAGGTGLRGC